MRLGPKLILTAALPTVIASLGLGVYSAFEQQGALRQSLERRGDTLARSLSERLGQVFAEGEPSQEQIAAVLDTLWEEDGLVSVEVAGLSGRVLASRELQVLPPQGLPVVSKRPVLLPAPPGESIREAVGLVKVVMDGRPVEREIEEVYRVSLSAATLVGVLGALLAALLGRLITSPLRALVVATGRLAKGQYSAQVPVVGKDEIALVSRSFNEMVRAISERDASLRQSRDALRRQTEELTMLAERLKETLREREELEATKEALSDMIVHDLKSPLTGIASATQLLLSTAHEEDRPFLEGMSVRARALLGMIDDLLTVRRMEENRLPLMPTSFDLFALAQEAADGLEPAARELGHAIVVEGEPVRVVADRQLMRRVLENLLGNALKYHRPPEPIRLVVRAEGEACQVEVIDRGPGIPIEYQQTIFERFRQVVDKGSGGRRGTGLGLTFCRMAVEAHQGRIWVESEEGKGACFSLQIPKKPRFSSQVEGVSPQG